MPENILPESGTIDLNNPNQSDENLENIPSTNVKSELVVQPETQLQQTENPQTEVVTTNPKEEVEPVDTQTEPEFKDGGDDFVKDGVTEEDGKIRPSAIAIAAIIAGFLVIAAGYVSYRYFSGGDSSNTGNGAPTASVQITNEPNVDDYEGMVTDLNGRIAGGVSTSRADEWENAGDSDGIVMTKPDTVSGSSSTSASSTSSNSNTGSGIAQANDANTDSQNIQTQTNNVMTVNNGSWRANDYKHGDIKAGSHTVVRGDTLWEIAEAVYGNGADWHKIADANNVSYLANGNPLIIPGQVLNIPT